MQFDINFICKDREKSLFFDITFWIADELSKLSSNNICLWNFMLNLACACWISGGGEGSYSYKYELCSQIDDESNGIQNQFYSNWYI